MAWMIPVGVAAAQMVSGKMGSDAATKANKDALKAAAKTLAETKAYFESIGIPPEEAQRIVMEQYQIPPEYKPLLEQEVQLQDSGMKSVAVDPNLQKARMGALAKLQGISDQQGNDIQSQVGIDQALEQARQMEQGQREAATMAMQRRGIAGGGAELALRESAMQNAANQAKMVSQQQAVAANQRALEALSQGTNLAGTLSREDIDLQTQQAQAQDMIDKFNAASKMDINQRNTASLNLGNLKNIDNTMKVGMANTDIANDQTKYNAQLPQQDFENRMARARGATGQTSGIVENIYKSGGQTAASNSAPYTAAAAAAPAVGDKLSEWLYPDNYDTRTGEKLNKYDAKTGKEK